MAVNVKAYQFPKGQNPALDAEFSGAALYNKVKPGTQHLFWKSGLRWYVIPYTQVQRIFRRVEPVYGKLCCGGRSFLIEWLVLVLHSGEELVIHIGDDVQRQAEQLLQHLKDTLPQLQFGKES